MGAAQSDGCEDAGVDRPDQHRDGQKAGQYRTAWVAVADCVNDSPAGGSACRTIHRGRRETRNHRRQWVWQTEEHDISHRTHGGSHSRDDPALSQRLLDCFALLTQISVSNVSVEFGATTVFSGVTFTVARGERWGILGRNGSGKTTLFSLITGTQQPTSGVISRQPGLRVALLEQHREFVGAETVWEAAAGEFAELLALEQSLANQAQKLAE